MPNETNIRELLEIRPQPKTNINVTVTFPAPVSALVSAPVSAPVYASNPHIRFDPNGLQGGEKRTKRIKRGKRTKRTKRGKRTRHTKRRK